MGQLKVLLHCTMKMADHIEDIMMKSIQIVTFANCSLFRNFNCTKDLVIYRSTCIRLTILFPIRRKFANEQESCFNIPP